MIETKEKFRQEVIQSIKAMFPEWEAEPKDEFAISIKAPGRNGSINLDNIYHEVQLHRKPKEILIRYFLSEFARVIRNAENSADNWDEIKDKIFLVVRPTDLYSDCLGTNHEKQLAFSLPVLPDLSLYWVVDNTDSWQYITNAQFSRWKVRSSEVMWWAYENTCKAEESMNTGEIGEVGLLISTNRRMGTVSHLLYEPKNLHMLIHSTRPDWPEQPYWICIPVPGLIIVVREGHDEAIRKISPIAQEHYGKVLSHRVYVFSNDTFSGEVVHKSGQKEPFIIDLEDHIHQVVLPD